MKQFFRKQGPGPFWLGWVAAASTAAWTLIGAADTPKQLDPERGIERSARPATTADGAQRAEMPALAGTQAMQERHLAAARVPPDSTQAELQQRQRTGRTDSLSSTDRQFLTQAAASGRAELAMGRLGQERASNAEVKRFAQRMVEDHSRVNEALKTLGDTRGLSWPGGDATSTSAPGLSGAARHAMERLQGLDGAAFDRAYMKQMVTDHKSAVAGFQRAATSADDPALRQFARKTLPTLQDHLQEARSLSDRLAATAGQP